MKNIKSNVKYLKQTLNSMVYEIARLQATLFELDTFIKKIEKEIEELEKED